jgi:hypothetical protein
MLLGWGPQGVIRLPALIFLLSLIGVFPAFAAQGPVGLWQLDPASLEKTVDQLVDTLIDHTPPEQRAEARRMMNEQREAMKEQMASSMAGTIEFAEDGSLIFNDPASPEIQRGRWRQEGDRLFVVDEDPDSPDLAGFVTPERMELSFQVDRDDPDQGPLADLVWVLVPVR